MGSGAVIYVPSFIKIGSGIQELIGRIHRHTGTATWSHKPTLFFQNKESRLKIMHSMLKLIVGSSRGLSKLQCKIIFEVWILISGRIYHVFNENVMAWKGVRDFSLLHDVHAGSRGHTPPLIQCIPGLVPRDAAARSWSWPLSSI
jgi:hypothetical protein